MEQIVIYLLLVQKLLNYYCSVDNMKKTGLKSYFHDVSVDYNAIAVVDILDIQKYLMKKNEIL